MPAKTARCCGVGRNCVALCATTHLAEAPAAGPFATGLGWGTWRRIRLRRAPDAPDNSLHCRSCAHLSAVELHDAPKNAVSARGAMTRLLQEQSLPASRRLERLSAAWP
jgi:hypothetical protein